MAQHYKIEEWKDEPWYDDVLIYIANEIVYSKDLTELPMDYAMHEDTEHVYMVTIPYNVADGVLDEENTHIQIKNIGCEVHVAKGKRIQQIYVPL